MTELIWDGKYKDGKKQGPVRIALPFQTIETVNESAQDRRRNLELFASGRSTEWRNRLIWGDKKYVLPSLLAELAGKIDLIYIDPPFDTGAHFSFTATIPEADSEGIEFTKQPSLLEQKAYRDTWGVDPEDRQRGVTSTDRYIKWFYETATILRELLAENGTLYVHCNQTMLPFLRGALDDLFGLENHMNDVIWHFENKPKFSFRSCCRGIGNAFSSTPEALEIRRSITSSCRSRRCSNRRLSRGIQSLRSASLSAMKAGTLSMKPAQRS